MMRKPISRDESRPDGVNSNATLWGLYSFFSFLYLETRSPCCGEPLPCASLSPELSSSPSLSAGYSDDDETGDESC